MNRTLEKVKASAESAARQHHHAQQNRLTVLKQQAEAAREVIDAFHDLENQYVKVHVLQQVWPMDYHTRDDRLRGLLTSILREDGEPYGIEIEIPGGHLRFTAQMMKDGNMGYSAIRDVGNVRPQVMDFVEKEDWMAFFYKSMAQIIEV